MLVRALTAIIGVVARGKNAKGIAGGVAGTILTAGEPIVDALWTGITAGALPQVEQLGVMLGQAVAGFVVGYVVTWLSPKNAEA